MLEPLGHAVACPPEGISWRVHPARRRWRSSLAAGSVILVAAIATGMAAGSPAAGLAAALVLTLSLHRFFFPSHFTIDGEGIRAASLMSRKRLRWSEVRRFVCDRHGGYLSTRNRPSRLDAFRGLH